jgi:hypothetical protein
MSAPPLPTEYATSEVTYRTSQDGFFDVGTGIWNEAGGGLISGQAGVGGSAVYLGLQFQLYTLSADQGYPLSPPVFPEPRPFDFVTGAVAETSPFDLLLSSVPGLNLNNGTLVIYMVPEVTPAEFSNVSPPGSRGEFVGFTNVLGSIIYVGPDATRQTSTLLYSVMKPYIQHPNFRGKIAFTCVWLASTGRVFWYSSRFGLATGQPPELQTRQTSFNTGMMVGESELKRRARVVHSYKSGFPYLSDEAIPDGYTEEIMMHADDYDPIDPVDQGRGDYVPSPSENVVDDEITDLEG